MKANINLVLSAILGSAITIGVFWLTENKIKNENVSIAHLERTPSRGVMYTRNDSGEFTPLDFSATAEDVMNSVVHIQSTITVKNITNQGYQYRKLPDPFRDFFGEDFYDQFFGPNRRSPNQQPEEFKQQSTGSGVIINQNGSIVTNNHVIADADEITVTLHNNQSYPATVIGSDPTTDLALIQIKAKELKPLPFVNSDDVKVGEWVMAVGNPFNLNSTVTAGIVSAKARNINILRDRYAIESFIQTDAAINPGNSGGALVNLQGGLVGINTAIASPTGAYAGYGFAVPSNMVNKIVEDLLKYGSVQRGILGVTIRSVNSKLVEENNLKIHQGVYVDSVMENSSAEEAGIKPGDVIVKINGMEIESSPELQELIARQRPGDIVSISVDRLGKKKEFKVTLKNKEGEKTIKKKEYSSILMSLGAEFEEIDKETAEKLEIKGGIRISRLYPGTIKHDTKIREGFIITKVDKIVVTTLKDFTDAIEGKNGGILLEGIYEDEPGVQYYGIGIGSL